MHPCVVMCMAVFVPLLCLHRSLRSVVPVALVVNWPVRAEPAPWSIESFAGGSYWLSLLIVLVVE